MARESEHDLYTAAALHRLALLAREQGDNTAARSLLAESLRIQWEFGNQSRIGSSLEAVAALKASEGEFEQAACLWGAAEALREVRRAVLPPDERSRYEQDVAAARAQLDEERFNAAWERGKAMTLEEAVAYALEAIRT